MQLPRLPRAAVEKRATAILDFSRHAGIKPSVLSQCVAIIVVAYDCGPHKNGRGDSTCSAFVRNRTASSLARVIRHDLAFGCAAAEVTTGFGSPGPVSGEIATRLPAGA